ncbi:hypothetical protein PHMEG_0005597 [Phytophthora megakarya]|uniref:Uncharacterized protein n=1 Tax=Phytophthora megakarya TaxID=4795 RepID=A0A225WR17_9STRA|nr:hypothetical protein PHMEG_0005591 [Phytophthora megakarya]OWZ20051.1 hypothetical protein PHMEG_0005597 [Phytophthora megakarya]
MDAVDITRTRIPLDTGSNDSMFTVAYANGYAYAKSGIMAEVWRWWRAYEFEMWIIDHSPGVDAVLWTDFMIPGGVRLNLFHGTAMLPDDVVVPLLRMVGFVDEEPYGAQPLVDRQRTSMSLDVNGESSTT